MKIGGGTSIYERTPWHFCFGITSHHSWAVYDTWCKRKLKTDHLINKGSGAATTSSSLWEVLWTSYIYRSALLFLQITFLPFFPHQSGHRPLSMVVRWHVYASFPFNIRIRRLSQQERCFQEKKKHHWSSGWRKQNRGEKALPFSKERCMACRT